MNKKHSALLKRQLRANKKRAKTRLARKAKRNNKDSIIPDFYKIVFPKLFESLSDQIEAALIRDPLELHRNFWKKKFNGKLKGCNAWELVFEYLNHVEQEMKKFISKHSYAFWLHLYRRIGVALHRGHIGTVNPLTTGHVREIMECAFIKFSSLSVADMGLANAVEPNQIFGGHFLRILRSMFSNPDKAKKTEQMMVNRSIWVPTRFNDQDFVELHYLEGLAYEYWLATARLRSIGKGSEIYLDQTGILREDRTHELDKLIKSYDARIEENMYTTTKVGSPFLVEKENKDLLPAFIYNINRQSMKNVMNPFLHGTQIEIDSNDPSNFYCASLDLSTFLESHKLLWAPFESKFGYSLRDYVLCIAVLYRHGLRFLLSTDKAKSASNCIQIFQRAYEYFKKSREELIKEIFDGVQVFQYVSKESVEKIVDSLTLTEEKQKLISLWTFGPRYPLYWYGDALIINYHGLSSLLNSLFFKLKFDQGRKGHEFEKEYGEYLKSEGFCVLDIGKVIRNNHNAEREIDVAVRIGSTLILCECRAMEMPFDFEIGKPKTLSCRQSALQTKVAQGKSLKEFIKTFPQGKNYDYRWASRTLFLVVSPFKEWIWSTKSDLWISEEVPRILEARESVDFFRTIAVNN